MSHPQENPDDPDAPAAPPRATVVWNPTYYEIVTTHVQRLISEAARLAALADGMVCDNKSVEVDGRTVLPIMVLDRAANLLQHAAQELLDEKHKGTGWPEV